MCKHLPIAYKLIYKSNLSLKQSIKAIKDKMEITDEIDNIIKFVESSDRGLI